MLLRLPRLAAAAAARGPAAALRGARSAERGARSGATLLGSGLQTPQPAQRPSRRLARGRAAIMVAAPICRTACCCACPAWRRPLPPAALLLRYAARGARSAERGAEQLYLAQACKRRR